MNRLAIAIALLAAVWAFSLPAFGADDRATSVATQRQAVAREIERLTTSQAETAKDQAAPQLKETLKSLRYLEALYSEAELLSAEIPALEARLAAEKKQLEGLETYAPVEPRPYSFLLLESLKDDLLTEQDREKSLKTTFDASKRSLDHARKALDSISTEDIAEAEEPGQEFAPARLPGLIARAGVVCKEARLRVQALLLDLSRTRSSELEKKIDVISTDVSFSKADLTRELSKLARREAALKAQLTDVGAQLNQLKPADDERLGLHEVYRTKVMLLDQQVEDIELLRQAWKSRYELAAKQQTHDQQVKSRDQLDATLKHFKAEASGLEQLRDHTVAQLARHHHAVDEQPDGKGSPLPPALRSLVGMIDENLLAIHSDQRHLDRYQDELKTQLAKSAGTLDGIHRAFLQLFGWKVAGGEDEPVTAGKLLLLLLVVIVGIILAYYISRMISRRVLSHFGFSRGQKAAIRSILFYLLCLVAGVFAFRLLSVPLTAFAFVGGAAAIAIGFGSQDIMNNFMSGLILLIEQPIRVGDVIDLGKVEGVVLHIGLRSTRLRTQSNHELIIPNKSLLDEQVTNFTLTDNVVRRTVTMTVQRSVPIAEAKRKMLRVARSHPLVLKSPAPVVFVKEIDNYYETTLFEVYFALHLKSFIECARVQSQILQRLGELFPPTTEPSHTETSNGEAAEPTEAADAPAPPSATPERMRENRLIKELRRVESRLGRK
jgi:small-conductance mechanosensitive channel